MKSKIYRIIVAVAVMAVMLLQVAWMAHTFMLYSTGGSDDVADSFVAFFYDNWLLIVASVFTDVAIVVGLIEHIRFAEKRKKLDDIRRDFSSTMIHHMKSPLSSIIMGVNALKSGKLDEKPEIRKRYFVLVENEAEHLLELTNRLLSISKLESQNLILSMGDVELRPMIEDVLEKYRARVKKSMIVNYKLNAHHIWGDREFVKEVFVNLVDNAVKYSRDEIEIVVESSTEHNFTRVTVRDNGQGIKREELPFVFDKYARAASPANVPGFGLGLYYVYQVMAAHQGRVTVDSRRGEFTQFNLFFPNIVLE